MAHFVRLCDEHNVASELKPRLIAALGNQLSSDGQVSEQDFVAAWDSIRPPEHDPRPETLSYEDWVPWLEEEGIPVVPWLEDEQWKVARRIVGLHPSATRKSKATFEMMRHGLIKLALDLEEANQPAPPGDTKNPEEGDVDGNDIAQLRRLVARMRDMLGAYQGAHRTPAARRRPEEAAVMREYQDLLSQAAQIFRREAVLLDPEAKRFKFVINEDWTKKQLLHFVHPDGNSEVTEEDLLHIFERAAGGKRRKGTDPGTSKGQPKQSSQRPPASDDEVLAAMVVTATRLLKRYPANRAEHHRVNANGFRHMCRWALEPFRKAHPEATANLANQAFKLAFTSIIDEVFAD